MEGLESAASYDIKILECRVFHNEGVKILKSCDFSKKEANTLLSSMPSTIMNNVSEEKAEEIISILEEGFKVEVVQKSWKCPDCGSNNDMTFVRCRCGHELSINENEDETGEKVSSLDSSFQQDKDENADDHEEFNNYLFKASGISRVSLNVMAFIGVFIFGWLMAVVYSHLGKGKQGWSYLIPMIICLSIGKNTGQAIFIVVGIIIYITAWIHANMILSRYEWTAKERIAEIKNRNDTEIDPELEKGIIEYKILKEKEQAINTLSAAVKMPGGEPLPLYSAGRVMSDNDLFENAKVYFNRALENVNDAKLKKQIEKSLSPLR